MPNRAHAEVLRTSPLFSSLSDAALAAVLRRFRHETWPRGAALPPGRALDSFTVVVTGRLEVIRYHPETDRQVTVFLLGPGDGFDVLTLLDGMMHDVVTRTVDPMESLVAPLASVHQSMDDHPEFGRALLPYIARQMRSLEDLASDLALHDTVTRLGHLILQHADPVDETSGDGREVRVLHGLSHDAIARMIGSVRAVVNRCLQELKAQDIVHLRRHRVRVNDLNALLERAHGLQERNKRRLQCESHTGRRVRAEGKT